jgi:Rps23 Pro-64 3,4-dihydroxylase Tpa1-like proline 4-hydroxylase
MTPEEYQNKRPYPHMFQDDVLPADVAQVIQKDIMEIPDEDFDRYDNPFEQKYTLRDKNKMPSTLKSLFEYLNSDRFVNKLSEFVGYKLLNDPDKNFWGVHKYKPGDKLDIHVDAGTHPKTGLKKQVTLGIYLSTNWKETYGCELEVWKGDNASSDDAKLHDLVAKIAPSFNRMIIFTCDDYSWHGNPIPATCPDDARRIFVTVSYLSDSADKFLNKRKKAFFIPRPEDPVDEEKNKLRFLRQDPEKYKEVYRYNMKTEY